MTNPKPRPKRWLGATGLILGFMGVIGVAGLAELTIQLLSARHCQGYWQPRVTPAELQRTWPGYCRGDDDVFVVLTALYMVGGFSLFGRGYTIWQWRNLVSQARVKRLVWWSLAVVGVAWLIYELLNWRTY